AYLKCLGIKFDYAPAREYLGEAYLEMGKVAQAREQLAVLERLKASDSVTELKASIDAYVAAHPEAAAPADSAAAAGGEKAAPGLASPCFGSSLNASTPSSIATLSSSIVPPLSSTLFQLMPQSLRLTWVVASNPAREPIMPTVPMPTSSASSVTGLVTPRMVRSPSILNF